MPIILINLWMLIATKTLKTSKALKTSNTIDTSKTLNCNNAPKVRIQIHTWCINFYRVSHIEMFLLKWLWQIEICKLDFVLRYLYIPEVWKFEFHQPVFKKLTLAVASTAPARKFNMSFHNSIKIFTDIWYLFCWRLLRPTYATFF